MFKLRYSYQGIKTLGWSDYESSSRELINIENNKYFVNEIKDLELSDILLTICVTMYNEDEITPTIEAIYKNLEDLEKIGIKEENVLLIIISDGIEKVHDKIKEELLTDNNNKLIEIPRKTNIKDNIIYTCIMTFILRIPPE